MEFIDSHCHFDFTAFDCDRDLIWRECNMRGIHSLIIPGITPQQWAIAEQMTQAENMYFGVGLHPWWIEKEIDTNNLVQSLEKLRQQLINNSALKKCVAIGECGLDAGIETPLRLQQEVLEIHLQLAQTIQMPLIIHCVKAHSELLQLLKKYRLPVGGVIHGFSGSYELALQYWAIGFRLGIGGTISYERANKTRQAAKQMPLNAILLETDAPDMPLQGMQGERNCPQHVILVAQTLADLRGEPLEHIAQQTTANAQQLFKINC